MGAVWSPRDIGDSAPLVADGQDQASGHPLCPAVSAELTGGDRAGTLTRLATASKTPWSRCRPQGHSDLCLVTMAGDKGILTYGHTPLFFRGERFRCGHRTYCPWVLKVLVGGLTPRSVQVRGHIAGATLRPIRQSSNPACGARPPVPGAGGGPCETHPGLWAYSTCLASNLGGTRLNSTPPDGGGSSKATPSPPCHGGVSRILAPQIVL